jgi:hypothetical protein
MRCSVALSSAALGWADASSADSFVDVRKCDVHFNGARLEDFCWRREHLGPPLVISPEDRDLRSPMARHPDRYSYRLAKHRLNGEQSRTAAARSYGVLAVSSGRNDCVNVAVRRH